MSTARPASNRTGRDLHAITIAPALPHAITRYFPDGAAGPRINDESASRWGSRREHNLDELPGRSDFGTMIGLDVAPTFHGHVTADQKPTGLPPVFSATARQRWAAERQQRALERLFS